MNKGTVLKLFCSSPHPFFSSSPTFLLVVVIVGDVSGKSSLVDRFICNEFSYNPVPTIGLHFRIKSVEVDSKEIKVRIWDTGMLCI